MAFRYLTSFILFLSSVAMAEVPNCFHPKNPPDPSAQKSSEQIVDIFLSPADAAKDLYPTQWSTKLQSKEFTFNDIAKTNYETGRAYAAIAYKKIDAPFAKVKADFSQPGFIFKLIENVKTLKDSKKISSSEESEHEFCISTVIDIPVLADLHANVKLRLYNASETRSILEWKQIDGSGELNYNQGAAVLEPDGDKSKLTVIGVHVLKPENKIPWYGRGTAHSFAKVHYGNFVEALDKTIIDKR